MDPELTPGLLHVAQLSPELQVQLMEAIVPSEFFAVIRTHTLMGFSGVRVTAAIAAELVGS